MPPIPVNAPPRPYVRSPYSSDTRALGSIYGRQGDILAESARMRGATSSQFLAGLAAAFQQIQAQEQAKQQQAIELAQEEAKLQRTEAIRQQDLERAAKREQGQIEREAAIYAAENTSPGAVDPRRAEVIRKFPGTAARLRLQETLPATVTPGAVGAVDQQPNQFDVLEPTPVQVRQSQLDTAARERDAQAAKDREADNLRQSERDREIRRHNRTMEARAGSRTEAEPLMAVIGDDGQPVYLPRSQATGRRPASNREQGRPVTSGDAGRIADFDTSLDDLKVLGGALSSAGSTGTVAKIGAGVPNWVTEYTGWGSDAKKKQALIDRVKQVIGKALEGGVLRKEDEVKYEKILPTVGDPNDLVLSKLGGLGDAIGLRRTRTIESLADAGYDTSGFEKRSTAPKDNDPLGIRK